MNANTGTPSALFDISGKVAVITGATGAFGRMAARTLAAADCPLVIAGGNGSELAALTSDLQEGGAKVTPVNLRPVDEESCAKIVDAAVTAYGRIDILVVASGTNDVALIADMDPTRFDQVMDANVRGSWLMCQAAGRHFIAQGHGGKVVLMSSARGKLGHPAGYTAYCASKSAVDGITRALGCEWGNLGITVNAIAPTVFRSALTEWMYADDERGRSVRAGMLSRIPLGRLGEPDDLAGPLIFLCAPASNFYTGHILYADGGYTAG